MTACIYYHPEAYSTAGPKLMGRNAAGQSFLRGFLEYSSSPEFWVQVKNKEHATSFLNAVLETGRSDKITVVDNGNLKALTNKGVVYHPGPGIGFHAWQREQFGGACWSLCGITHTTSSAGAMDAIADLISSPVQTWDALICTSISVKKNVEAILQNQVDYLRERLGITKVILPASRVIPLGIHTDDFNFNGKNRVEARNQLGIDDDSLAVLFIGRLSFHAKAHPLAMYQALEESANRTGKKVFLIECGWYANTFIEAAFDESANLACPSIRRIKLDGRKELDRQIAWGSADIFCSLSDNIQETFGIAPIEAMAASLPVIVSDWDGYKDTVRDGVDGFRIPTLMPQPGLGGDLAMRHALEIDTYDMYCGHTSSLVSVDIIAATQAFIKLFESSTLRRQMGESGRERAQSLYDWKYIIPQYESLWLELNEIRNKGASGLKSNFYSWPARMDPFYSFSNYPTDELRGGDQLVLVDSNIDSAMQRISAYLDLAMVRFSRFVQPSLEEIESVIRIAGTGQRSAIDLVSEIDQDRKAFVFRSLLWLIKLNILRVNQSNH